MPRMKNQAIQRITCLLLLPTGSYSITRSSLVRHIDIAGRASVCNMPGCLAASNSGIGFQAIERFAYRRAAHESKVRDMLGCVCGMKSNMHEAQMSRQGTCQRDCHTNDDMVGTRAANRYEDRRH
jgi:hypothetical protein